MGWGTQAAGRMLVSSGDLLLLPAHGMGYSGCGQNVSIQRGSPSVTGTWDGVLRLGAEC